LVVKMHNFAITQNFKIGSDSTINIGSSGDLFRGLGVVTLKQVEKLLLNARHNTINYSPRY
jgi:hypothetical protein